MATSLLTVTVGGIAIWYVASKQPIYLQSHSHAELDDKSHEHPHTHGEGLNHGHVHVGLIGSMTHSHPHRHGHQHGPPNELAAEQGMTLIGHQHAASEIVNYFGRATVSLDREVEVNFLRSDGMNLLAAHPLNSKIGLLVFNGADLQARVVLTASKNRFSGSLPAGFLCLPTHTVKLIEVDFEQESFSPSLPLVVSN